MRERFASCGLAWSVWPVAHLEHCALANRPNKCLFSNMLRALLSLSFVLYTLSMTAQDAPPTPKEIQILPDDSAKVLAWIRLSNISQRTSFNLMIDYGDSALVLAEKIQFQRGIALAHSQIGTGNFYGGNLDQALLHFQHTLDYYRSINDSSGAARLLNNMGTVARLHGHNDTAMVYFFEALAIREAQGNLNEIAYTFQRIGETYSMMEEYEKSEEYLFKALDGYREVGDTNMEHSMLLNIGAYFNQKGEPDSAINYIREALEFFEVHGPPSEAARGYYNLGGIYLAVNNLDSSETAYRKALQHFESLGQTMYVVGSGLNLAEIAFKKGNTGEAIRLAASAKVDAEKISSTGQLKLAHFKLYIYYKAQNKFREALEHREAHDAINDSLRTIESKAAVAELEKKYQTEKSEKELAELAATNAMNELALKKQRNRQNVQTAITALILLSAVLLFFLYRNHKRSNKTLQEKNAIIQTSLTDKEVLLKEIHHRVKNNLQFISSLLNLQARHVADPNTLAMLTEGKNRINSMALVHQKLYQEDNLKGVNMKDYIENLLESLEHSLKVDANRIEVDAQIEPIVLDIDTATPIGLVLNELITNAFKYAFQGEASGVLHVRFKEQDSHLILDVRDNGVGLPTGFDLGTTKGFGFELVHSLAQKLKATVDIKTNEGVIVTLTIKSFKKA